MPNRLRDLTGANIGRFTVLRQGPRHRGRTYWVCVCACTPTREVQVRGDVLTRNTGTRNCGCLKREQAARLARKPDGDIGYLAAHDRVRKEQGSARSHTCESCGQQAADWAFRHDAKQVREQLAGPFAGLPFSPDPSDYQPMCRPCHNSYDGQAPWRTTSRLVEALTQTVLNGIYEVGAALPTGKEIAEEHGVGTSTASRALKELADRGLAVKTGSRYRVAAVETWTFQPSKGGSRD